MAITFPVNRPSKTPFVTFSFFDTAQRGARSTLNPVTLFMPPAFQITDGHEYEFAEQGKANKFFDLLGGFFSDGVQGTENIIGTLGQMFGLGGDVAQQLAEEGKSSRDPKFFNYKEPRPREFTFTYKFEPKDKFDAASMMLAINTLRVASYPTALPGGRQYKVPDSVKITFSGIYTSLGVGSTFTLPNTFAIKEVNTTISEGEQVVTFSDGYPTQVSMQVQFAETVLLTREGDALAGDRESNVGVNQGQA